MTVADLIPDGRGDIDEVGAHLESPAMGPSDYVQARKRQLAQTPHGQIKGYERLALSWFGMVPGAQALIGSNFAMISAALLTANDWMDLGLLPAAQFHTAGIAHDMWEKNIAAAKREHAVQFNGRLWTHNEDGTLNHVTSRDILPFFEEGKQEEWPQLLLTTNHARTETHGDISGMMNNFCAFVQHALKPFGANLDLIRDIKSFRGSAKGKAIMLSAVRTEDTSYGNAAATIYRYNCLRDAKYTSLEERMVPGERHYKDAVEARLSQTSPASIRLAKLMLKLMVKNPDTVDVDAVMPIEYTHDGHDMPLLRDDAAEIARHITVMGYSMGAQTACDAVRYLAMELRSVDQHQYPNINVGQSNRNVSAIMSQLAFIGTAGPLVKMTREEEGLGINRTIINSEKDLISYHFALDSYGGMNALRHAANASDRIFLVKSTEEDAGHSPDAALGHGDTVGYILKNTKAKMAIENVFASKFISAEIEKSSVMR